MNPSTVDTDAELRREQAKEGPREPVIDDIASLAGVLGACEQGQNRFVGNGGIIERQRARKNLLPAMPCA
jgi:hypothetical protein